MRIVALELNNDIKGMIQREKYIEALIEQLPAPNLSSFPNWHFAVTWRVKRYGTMPMIADRKRQSGLFRTALKYNTYRCRLFGQR